MLGLFTQTARCRHAAAKSFIVMGRNITTTPMRNVKKMPDRPAPISEDEFTESFLKGSGPGGQKIVSSKKPLRHF